MLKKISIFIFVGTFGLLIFSFISYANDNQIAVKSSSNTNLLFNPFELARNRIVPGTKFQMKIDKNLFNEKLDKVTEMTLEYETLKKGQEKLSPIKSYYYKYVDDELFLFAWMPSWSKINKIRKQSFWGGWLKPYKAHVKLSLQKDKTTTTLRYPVEIPSVLWAYVWGILAVFGSFIIISLWKPEPLKKQDEFSKDKSKENWERSHKIKRFFLYPLNFAITPLGTYSISITQILFWTFITIFGIIYVYWLSGFFLEITPQILVLLGIGGGTALAAKINALSRIYDVPSKYLSLVERTRTPKLKDLISIGGQPNIFKFQMFAFTLITGYIVIVEILKSHSFPIIPSSLVTMMGVSSLIYLGNEVSHKDVWDKIKKKIKIIESKAEKDNLNISNPQEIEKSGIPEVEELKCLLEEIYSGEEKEEEQEKEVP